MKDILSRGSLEDISKFIKEKNIFNDKVFNVNDILYLMKNKNNY